MPCQTVLMPMVRFTALKGLVLALTLLPSPLWMGDAFARSEQMQCADRYWGCMGRCQAKAEKKTGTTVKAQGNNPDAAVHQELANCEARTCKPQADKCIAAAKGGKNARPLTPQKATRSPQTAPAQPLTSSPTLRHRGR